MIGLLLDEDGDRWMTEQEQFHTFPSSKELRPYQNRPVWLVLSIVMREQGYSFRNGLGIHGQMQNMRNAFVKRIVRD